MGGTASLSPPEESIRSFELREKSTETIYIEVFQEQNRYGGLENFNLNFIFLVVPHCHHRRVHSETDRQREREGGGGPRSLQSCSGCDFAPSAAERPGRVVASKHLTQPSNSSLLARAI